jgi:hypothetical protein
MTTFVYKDQTFAIDSQVSLSRAHASKKAIYEWTRVAHKFRLTPLFLASGAGSTFLLAFLFFLPVIFALRVFGFVILPFQGSASQVADTHNLVVLWRWRRIWAANLRCSVWGPLMLVRVHSSLSYRAAPSVSMKGGSGASFLDFETMDAMDAAACIRYAGRQCLHTNTRPFVFDHRRWKVLATPLPLGTYWTRLRADLHLLSHAYFGWDGFPPPSKKDLTIVAHARSHPARRSR